MAKIGGVAGDRTDAHAPKIQRRSEFDDQIGGQDIQTGSAVRPQQRTNMVGATGGISGPQKAVVALTQIKMPCRSGDVGQCR
ncbi:hypothetical protein D3C79_986330 [compost metagenome]